MNKAIKYSIHIASTLLLTFLASIPFGLFKGVPLARVLSDSFFFCGVIESGVAVISWSSAHGAFDLFGYAAKVVSSKFKSKDHVPSYYDYISERKENSRIWFRTLLFCGLACIAIAAVLLVLC